MLNKHANDQAASVQGLFNYRESKSKSVDVEGPQASWQTDKLLEDDSCC